MPRWFTPAGRLKSRTWARGQHTRYDYDDGGRLRFSRYFTHASADTGTNPGNDPNTPDVAITYDRLGRQTSQSNGLASNSFTYDPTTLQLDTETISYDFNLDNTPDLVRVLDRSQDSLGRSTGYQLKIGGTTESAAVYNFSPTTGRLDSVGNGTDTFTYAYTANSSLLESVTKSGSPVIQTTHTWEPTRNVLDMKENKVGSTVVSSYDYSVNDLGQRTAVDTAGSAFTAGERDRTWSYDALGQVTAESDANNTAFHRGFAYDAIGNRTASIEGNTDPTQAGATNYTPTTLNQYDAIGVFSPTYDDDGNQLESQIRPLGSSSLESCVFVWDSENRLIEIKDAAGTTTLASYAYDSQSRRIARTVGTTSIVTLYDAWNPIAEYTGTPATGFSLQASYLWGLDLSGSMQGAGGVGGLLSVTSGAGSFYPTYDGNGNISEYLDAAGVAVAHYEYDAFGNVIFSSGASATSFQHRFSTKPQDAESGLYYYGYRYYDPVTGRWPSRDPIEEQGGVNLYGFVGNGGMNQVDAFGLIVYAFYQRCEGDKVNGKLTAMDAGDGSLLPNGQSQNLGMVHDLSFFSGMFEHQVLPDGIYLILEQAKKPGFFRLEPVDSVFGDDMHEETGRTGFRLHYHGASQGCLTATNKDNNEWDKLSNMLRSTHTETREVDSNSWWKGLVDDNPKERITMYGYLLVETVPCNEKCACRPEDED